MGVPLACRTYRLFVTISGFLTKTIQFSAYSARTLQPCGDGRIIRGMIEELQGAGGDLNAAVIQTVDDGVPAGQAISNQLFFAGASFSPASDLSARSAQTAITRSGTQTRFTISQP